MIREAVLDDVPAIVALGRSFVSEDHYARFLMAKTGMLTVYMTGVVAGTTSAILISESAGSIVGMLGIQVADHPMSGEKTAAELFWYVLPEHRNGVGRELMKAAEAWARSRGAAKLQMTAPDQRVAKVYERRGFAHVESTYQKELA